MITPKYLADGTNFKVVLLLEYDDCMTFLVLCITRRTSHLSGLKHICQVVTHSCNRSRSFCKMSQSLLAFIRLYSRQSSANSLGVDWTQEGRSLM